MSYVKQWFEKEYERAVAEEGLQMKEASDIANDIADEIIESADPVFIDINKKMTGYGTYKSAPFVNEFHYGEKLAKAIEKALSGHICHGDDKFNLENYQEEIAEEIFKLLY